VSGYLEGIEGVEDVQVNQPTGQVVVRCGEGQTLTREQVAEALAGDARFDVTEFVLQETPAEGATPTETQ